jgi:hypothetical protein
VDTKASSSHFYLSTFGVTAPRIDREMPFGTPRSITPEPEDSLLPSDIEKGNSTKKAESKSRNRLFNSETQTSSLLPQKSTSSGGSSLEHSRLATPVKGSEASSSLMHRYPPTHTPLHSGVDSGLTITGAAKVLKSTMLYDARDLKGKHEGLGGRKGSSWDITSAHDAKVCALSVVLVFPTDTMHVETCAKYLSSTPYKP